MSEGIPDDVIPRRAALDIKTLSPTANVEVLQLDLGSFK
jgi:hypothetical protein